PIATMSKGRLPPEIERLGHLFRSGAGTKSLNVEQHFAPNQKMIAEQPNGKRRHWRSKLSAAPPNIFRCSPGENPIDSGWQRQEIMGSGECERLRNGELSRRKSRRTSHLRPKFDSHTPDELIDFFYVRHETSLICASPYTCM